MTIKTQRTVLSFLRNRRGSISIPMVFAIIPAVTAIGVAIDFGRAVMFSDKIQASLDSALLASVSQPEATRKDYADLYLAASLKGISVSTAMETITGGGVEYRATYVMPTMFTPFLQPSVTITKVARGMPNTAAVAAVPDRLIPGTPGTPEQLIPGTPAIPGSPGWYDDSCILTLGEDLDLDPDNIMTWNGSPSVQLTGCSLRSNRSMKCNGHDLGALASYAHGSVTGSCPNPVPGQALVPDMYQPLQTNVSPLCGTVKTGYTWAPTDGTLPAASATVVYPATPNEHYNEIHICGTLTLSGTKQLVANATAAGAYEPDKDTLIVIENGGLTLADDAAITAKRVTFFLLGKNADAGSTDNPVVTWPNGNGNMASLISTPGYNINNPFRGFSLYQDPDNDFDQDWKPGANARFDGIVYLPKARLTLSGNMQYGTNECLKIVVGQFRLNGNVNIQLKQDPAKCLAMNLRRYEVAPVAAVAGTPDVIIPGTPGTPDTVIRGTAGTAATTLRLIK